MVDSCCSSGHEHLSKKLKVDESKDAGAFFKLGDGFKVSMKMHAENRQRLIKAMHKKGATTGTIVLRGGESLTRNDTDFEYIFRQESYFNWVFGVMEPDGFGTVSLSTGKTTLFIPNTPIEDEPWIGKMKPREDYKTQYEVDDVLFNEDLPQSASASDGPLYILDGVNTDSGNRSSPAHFDGMDKLTVDKTTLYSVIANCRVTKSALELELMRYVSDISSKAHVAVMRKVKAGMFEFQLEADFLHYIYFYGGCRHTAYTCICGCGPNAGTLHYGHAGAPNSRILTSTDIALLDMGGEYHCYTSDITISVPVSGKFTPQQKMIYEGVLSSVRAVEEAMKPGIEWPEMHRLASRTILEYLTTHGLLKGNVDDMVKVNLAKVFLPCGLGHLIGCDYHDVGGYLPGFPERIDEGPYGIKKLRTARTLEKGMVLTVEPGIYFIDSLLTMAKNDPKLNAFMVWDEVDKFRTFGGVRIEDVVAVTDSGIENYTLVPRTVTEIEDVMAGKQWPPATDEGKWMNRRWYDTLAVADGKVGEGK